MNPGLETKVYFKCHIKLQKTHKTLCEKIKYEMRGKVFIVCIPQTCTAHVPRGGLFLILMHLTSHKCGYSWSGR